MQIRGSGGLALGGCFYKSPRSGRADSSRSGRAELPARCCFVYTLFPFLTDFPELPLLTKLTEIMPPDGFRKVQKCTISSAAVHEHIFERKKE